MVGFEETSLKKLVLAIAGLALGVVNAAAADLDVHPYAAPMIRPAYDWSGFYFGLNGGYGWSQHCWNLQSSLLGGVLGPDGCTGANGAVAGGQFGYRSQINSLVYGFEAQADWSSFKGSTVSNAVFAVAPGDLTNRSQIDAYALFTAQVGFTLGNMLLYAKGGAAATVARYKEIQTTTGALAANNSSDNRFGGTAGAGIEFGFAPGWSAGVVYDHLFMGTRNVSLTSTGLVTGVTPAGALVATDRIRQDVDIVTARVNYVFGGPSISKY